jgi:polyhydroxyalkanoate synthesis regulator phasin
MEDKEKLISMMLDLKEEIDILENRLRDIRNTRWQYFEEYIDKYGKEE